MLRRLRVQQSSPQGEEGSGGSWDSSLGPQNGADQRPSLVQSPFGRETGKGEWRSFRGREQGLGELSFDPNFLFKLKIVKNASFSETKSILQNDRISIGR